MPSRLILFVVICAVACSTNDGDGSPDAINDVASWTLGAPSVRIGGSAEHGGVQLTDIQHLIALNDGSIVVRDAKLPSVLRFDSAGTLVNLIGAPGQGPAEYATVTQMGVRADSVWLADIRRRRMVFFTPTGALLGARPWLPWIVPIGEGTIVSVTPRGLLANGWMVAHALTPTPPDGTPVAPPHGTVGPLILVDSTSTARDTIEWLAQASSEFMLDMKMDGNLLFPGPNHFVDTPLWRVARDGSVLVLVDRAAPTSATTSEYRVRAWTGSASLVFDRRVPYTPVPVNPATVDSIIEVFTDDVVSFYPARDIARRLVTDSLRWSAFYAPVTDVVVGTDGRLWLAREGLSTPPFDRRRYDVLSADGTLAGRLTLDRPGQILAATRSAVWVVELDADDVPTLLRYPLTAVAQ